MNDPATGVPIQNAIIYVPVQCSYAIGMCFSPYGFNINIIDINNTCSVDVKFKFSLLDFYKFANKKLSIIEIDGIVMIFSNKLAEEKDANAKKYKP
jgi:hypothetical protein